MSSAVSHSPSSIRDLKWAPDEKTIARQAFDKALKKELDEVVRKAKERAARIKHPSELWELENWLGKCRREIDSTYDYRYSVLLYTFATLLRRRRIRENDLAGLAEEKLDAIRFLASC
ncbi:MAG TPA: hypothetical protein VGF82_15360 [Terracidiphilus sp.]|jgi:hypothetical protein